MVRHDICRHSYAVEGGLIIGFCGQPHCCNWPYQVLISLIIHGLCWTVSGQVKSHVMQTCTNRVLPNHPPVIVASDRPWHVTINKIWRQTKYTPRSGWWRSCIAGIDSDCSTREMNTKNILTFNKISKMTTYIIAYLFLSKLAKSISSVSLSRALRPEDGTTTVVFRSFNNMLVFTMDTIILIFLHCILMDYA